MVTTEWTKQREVIQQLIKKQVVAEVKEFYPYLYGRSFTLLTDYNPLTSLQGLEGR